MVCSCKIPVEKYPETADWGPLFWKLLHSLAERSGAQKDAVLRGDEVRCWIQILVHLEQCIPCDVCRTHYGEWVREHTPSVLLTKPYTEIGPWIRGYLWSLHNRINEGNTRPTFEYSQLSIYRNVEIKPLWKALEPIMKLAIGLSGVPLRAWLKWLGYVRTVQGIYGV